MKLQRHLMLKKRILYISFLLISTNVLAQQTTQFKLNVLPIVLNGYGASIEQKVFKQFAIELGVTVSDRITLILDPSIPKLKDPFRERHFYLNVFRNIEFSKNHFLQFGTQFNLYSRSDFSNTFIDAFEKLNNSSPNSNNLFVTSILLGYKGHFWERWNLGFQLAYNLRNNTETQSAFSVTIGYGINSISKKLEIFY